jgi:hypothetical protein
MIVRVTRGDLRDEFIMANEAFALSPISARATQPSEEDYDAISEAFMETSRGRWFLGEYAKRNRNADTSMVLDAVARIEQSLAAQKQPPPGTGLAEALAAIKGALAEARGAASAAFDNLALEENLAPVRKGARIIREISWRWREIGADSRICDLIDSQVSAIEASCGQVSSSDPRAALNAAFDLLEERVAEFDDGDAANQQAAEEAVLPASPAPSGEMPATALETAQAAAPAIDVEAVANTQVLNNQVLNTEVLNTQVLSSQVLSSQVLPAEEAVATAEAAEMIADAADVATEAAEVTTEVAEMTAEAADAQDDALLEMIALEMAAPDASETDNDSDIDAYNVAMRAAALPPAQPQTIAERPEASATPVMAQAIQPSLPASLDPSLKPSFEPSVEPSLGSTLVASGIVQRPGTSASDPLAPIRRLSQVERIALFS